VDRRTHNVTDVNSAFQICHKKLLSRSCWCCSSVWHHKVCFVLFGVYTLL